MPSQERFKRGDEEIRARYDDNDMLIGATLYRYGQLVERTDSVETVKRWLTREAP